MGTFSVYIILMAVLCCILTWYAYRKGKKVGFKQGYNKAAVETVLCISNFYQNSRGITLDDKPINELAV